MLPIIFYIKIILSTKPIYKDSIVLKPRSNTSMHLSSNSLLLETDNKNESNIFDRLVYTGSIAQGSPVKNKLFNKNSQVGVAASGDKLILAKEFENEDRDTTFSFLPTETNYFWILINGKCLKPEENAVKITKCPVDRSVDEQKKHDWSIESHERKEVLEKCKAVVKRDEERQKEKDEKQKGEVLGETGEGKETPKKEEEISDEKESEVSKDTDEVPRRKRKEKPIRDEETDEEFESEEEKSTSEEKEVKPSNEKKRSKEPVESVNPEANKPGEKMPKEKEIPEKRKAEPEKSKAEPEKRREEPEKVKNKRYREDYEASGEEENIPRKRSRKPRNFEESDDYYEDENPRDEKQKRNKNFNEPKRYPPKKKRKYNDRDDYYNENDRFPDLSDENIKDELDNLPPETMDYLLKKLMDVKEEQKTEKSQQVLDFLLKTMKDYKNR